MALSDRQSSRALNAGSPSLEDEILQEIEDRREELVDLCARMVAQPSVNPPGETAGVAQVIKDYLEGCGLTPELVAIEPAAPNVVASVGRSGPHVVFNGHMDTMLPGREEDWSVPVMSMTRKDGRLYGLGMGNMKAGVAAQCLALAVLGRHQQSLPGRVSLTAVSDEVMFGNRGTKYLLDQRPDLYGDYLICAEGPGDMGFAIAEKGLLWADITATGPAMHSSRAMQGQTAVARLASFLGALDELNSEYAQPPAELHTLDLSGDRIGMKVSANVGTLKAGLVRSLIADTAIAQADIRLPPGITLDAMKERVTALAGAHEGITVSFPKGWGASWAPSDHALVQCIDGVIEAIGRRKPQHVVRLPGSDARYWRDKGVPAICFGPQPTLSSDVDDYANEDDVIECAKIYALSALRLLAADERRA